MRDRNGACHTKRTSPPGNIFRKEPIAPGQKRSLTVASRIESLADRRAFFLDTHSRAFYIVNRWIVVSVAAAAIEMDFNMSRCFQFAAVCSLFLTPLLAPGCGSKNRNQPDVVQSAPVDVHTVHIDTGDNGAAGRATSVAHREQSPAPRSLVFETSGVAPVPEDGASQEEWASAREAAVLDALAKAVIESRRAAGLSEDNFVETFASRLFIAHRITDDGKEFEVRLKDHGMERLFLVRDGRLQHPPHDFELVRKIFHETGGEFALLPTRNAPLSRYVARVGCYAMPASNARFAGEVDSDRAWDDGEHPDAQTP